MGTLREHSKRCLMSKRDVSETPLKSVITQLKACKYGQDRTADEEAVKFYMMNHLVGHLRISRGDTSILTDKEDDLVEAYFTTCNESAIRMFYYMLMICTRESRHVAKHDKFYTNLAKNYGAKVCDFNKSLHGAGSSGAVLKLKSNCPDVNLGLYCDALVFTFFNGSFSGGYGGQKWGAVAKVLRNFVYGEISAEIMVDNAFNLCHNNWGGKKRHRFRRWDKIDQWCYSSSDN